MSIDIYQGASPEQRDIIDSTGGIFVNAVPGSGKTTTAAKLFIRRALRDQNKYRGVAFLSYSNVAILETKKAINNLGINIDINSYNYLGTLDSFIDRFIISKFYYICEGLTRKPLVSNSIPSPNGLNFDINKIYLSVNFGASKIVFKQKTGKETYETYPYNQYKNLLINIINSNRLYNHNLRWLIAFEILKNKKIAALITNRFPEIIIDEAQDTKVSALLTLLNLNTKQENPATISLIGDTMQNIYFYNDAQVNFLNYAVKHWKLKTLPLSTSYRLPKLISRFINDIFGCQITSDAKNTQNGNIFISYIGASSDKINKNPAFRERQSIYPERFRAKIQGIDFLPRDRKAYIKDILIVIAFRDIIHDITKSHQALLSLLQSICSGEKHKELSIRCAELLTIRSEKISTFIGSYIFDFIEQINNMLTSLGCPKYNQLTDNEVRELNTNGNEIYSSLKAHCRTTTIHSTKGETHDIVTVKLTTEQSHTLYNHIKEKNNNTINQLSEELRVLFVAFTRAKSVLHIIFPKDFPYNHYKEIRDLYSYINEI